MDRRTRTIIVVALAMVFASAATYGVYWAIISRPVKEVPIAETFVVVATQTVPVGMLLSKEMVRVAPWPADAQVAGAYSTVEEVIGRGVIVGLVANEPVIETKLAPREAGGGLPPTITPGMRAISVRVNEVIGVAGFIQRGSRVDVIVTLPGQQSMTRTVISNAQVLAAGTSIDEDKARQGGAVQSTVVTLLLTPPDAERLSLASAQGQIQLALRNPLDVEKTETAGVRTSGLLGSLGPEPVRTVVRGQTRVVTPAPPPPPKELSVVVSRGNQVTKEIIKK